MLGLGGEGREILFDGLVVADVGEMGRRGASRRDRGDGDSD